MNRLAIPALFLLFIFNAYSQKPDIQFERISVQQGLSDHSIFCITQDHNGFIWIGGLNGFYKYNGYEFTSFQDQSDCNNCQTFGRVYRIREDNLGLLWILSDVGLLLYKRIYDEKIDTQMYGSLMSVLISFAQKIIEGGLKSIKLDFIRFTVLKVNDFLFVANSSKKIKEKKVQEELRKISKKFFTLYSIDWFKHEWKNELRFFEDFGKEIKDSFMQEKKIIN